MTTKTADIVLLVPGFLGFDRLGSFYYFGDRVSSLLRGHLEAVLEHSVPVIPLALGPADGILLRQRMLVKALLELAPRFEGARIHLVGHSAGGVDAELLLAAQTVDGHDWPAEFQARRQRIASVTTVASPHYGTTLALADVTRLLERPATNLARLGALIPALFALGAAASDRAATKFQLLGDPGAVRALVRQLWMNRELLRDLMPERMEALRRERLRELTHVPVTCYATCAIANPAPTSERLERPDALFLYLTNHTAGAHVDKLAPEVQANLDVLNLDGVSMIASSSVAPRPKYRFSPVDNDAVVNTARQLLPNSGFGGVVHADHADVLGHYDRRDPLHPDRFVREGIFRSGARFGDNEFFALYRAVARDILSAIQGQQRRSAPQRVAAAVVAAVR